MASPKAGQERDRIKPDPIAKKSENPADFFHRKKGEKRYGRGSKKKKMDPKDQNHTDPASDRFLRHGISGGFLFSKKNNAVFIRAPFYLWLYSLLVVLYVRCFVLRLQSQLGIFKKNAALTSFTGFPDGIPAGKRKGRGRRCFYCRKFRKCFLPPHKRFCPDQCFPKVPD